MIYQVILAAFLGAVLFLWYYERRRREMEEIKNSILRQSVNNLVLREKIAEHKKEYDKAKDDFFNTTPPDMFEHLGKPDPSVRLATRRPGLDGVNPSPEGTN